MFSGSGNIWIVALCYPLFSGKHLNVGSFFKAKLIFIVVPGLIL
jgi:hypothetical protein